MKNKIIKKGLVFGFVLIFVGTSIVSAITNTNQIKAKDTDNTIKVPEQTIYNLIGEVIVTFDYRTKNTSIVMEWRPAEDRNFSYPITNGNVSVNYTIKLQVYSVSVYLFPRIVMLSSTVDYPLGILVGYNRTRFIPISFRDTFPGHEEYLYIQTTHPMQTPPPDPGSNRTMFYTWNNLIVFSVPLKAGDEKIASPFHEGHIQIDFNASFYEPES